MTVDRSDFRPVCGRQNGLETAARAVFRVGDERIEMTGFIQQRHRGRRLTLGVALAVGATLALSACSGTTYGTGRSPGMQTLEDLAGIAAISSAKKEPIDYTPRPKVVLPPNVAELPPPGSGVAAQDPNWPVDPEKKRAKILADADARDAAGIAAPKGLVPIMGKPKEGEVNPTLLGSDPSKDAMPKPGEEAGARKLFAEAKGIAVDENGQPVRRYLSDPPSEYRVPDPTAPLEIIDKPKAKKKFKWWWQ